jgi:hypothetical protein
MAALVFVKDGGNRVGEVAEDFGSMDGIDQAPINKKRYRRVRVVLHVAASVAKGL